MFRVLKFIPISIDIILKIPENTYELFVVFFKKNFPDTWIFLKVKYDELTRERKIIDTDTTNFFNQLNFRKINKFLKLNNIKFKLKISIMYVKIVMMCKFYNININEIMKHRQLITSQIANTEFIFNDIYLHENNIEVIDKCLKDKLNYNLRPYVKKSIIDIIFIIYTTISKFTGSIFNPKK